MINFYEFINIVLIVTYFNNMFVIPMYLSHSHDRAITVLSKTLWNAISSPIAIELSMYSFFLTCHHTRNFSSVVAEFTNIHTQTSRPGTTIYKQIFVPCGNRTHDTQRNSQSLDRCANRVVNK